METQIKNEFELLKTEGDCSIFHAKYLGKSGEITALISNIRNLSNEERIESGRVLNILKRETESNLFKLQKEIKEREINEKLMNDKLVDITIPSLKAETGSLHPITRAQREIEQAFRDIGFIIESGPEIVSEYENFTAVNVPEDHPGRDMQDTFWLSNGQLLNTQTSSLQNHCLRKYGPEFRAFWTGRCYRNENLDARHEQAFFQVEGMMIGKDISIANLIYFNKQALQAVLNRTDIDVRLRPSYFPFTEPSFETDATCIFCDKENVRQETSTTEENKHHVGCGVCKGTGWVELGGCGMVHPNVLAQGGVDPNKYQGFAFCYGLTRLVMLKYNISDIRVFNSGNLEALGSIKGGAKNETIT